jgi:hypothetical protein
MITKKAEILRALGDEVLAKDYDKKLAELRDGGH